MQRWGELEFFKCSSVRTCQAQDVSCISNNLEIWKDLGSMQSICWILLMRSLDSILPISEAHKAKTLDRKHYLQQRPSHLTTASHPPADYWALKKMCTSVTNQWKRPSLPWEGAPTPGNKPKSLSFFVCFLGSHTGFCWDKDSVSKYQGITMAFPCFSVVCSCWYRLIIITFIHFVRK